MTTENRKKLWTALALYPAAYIYVLISGSRMHLWLGIFVLLYIALVEYMNWGKPIPKESLLWLSCILLITLSVIFQWSSVWDEWLSLLFIHALAVWWTLSRSGALLENRSGSLLPLDCFNGLIRFPFGGFFQRAKVLGQSLRLRESENPSGKKGGLIWGLAAAAAGVLLLYQAANGLAAADTGFAALTSGILAFFSIDSSVRLTDFLIRFAFSLPVGAWLFGLISGSASADRAELDVRAVKAGEELKKLCRVPMGVWYVCMAAFSLVYLLFFIVQGGYLFGAFFRRLPESFVVAEYARQGFFELCRVTVINFALLWLVLRTGDRPIAGDRLGKLLCTLLMVAGALFAVVALSKLGLYISCFGFTQKRLQSTWLALVLLGGGLCSIYSLWTEKGSFRFWLMFSAVTLSLLHIV